MRKCLCSLLAAAALSATPLVAQDDNDLFTRLDANKDGFITADEIPEDNKSKFERQLRTSDKDGDKKLSKDEFAASLKPDDAPRQPLGAGGAPGRFDGRQANPEAIFNEMDANKDGKLSKEEARGPLEQSFDRVDADGDGSISKEEFRLVARRFMGQPQPDPAQIEQVFNRWDANSDGKLTKGELPEDRRPNFERFVERRGLDSLNKEQFRNVFMAIAGPRPGEERPPMGPGPFIRVLDADGDGEISAGEIEAAPKALLSLDRNKDGKLTMEELGPPPPREGERPVEGRPAERRPGAGRPGGNFNPIANFDKDGDGKLSKEEAPERMKEGFDRIDTNNDGLIDSAEVRQAFSRRDEGGRDRERGERRPDGERRPEGARPDGQRRSERP